MKKKISLTAGVLALALTLCACGEELDTGSRVWVDSDLEDSIKESDEFRAQDDFAAYVNKDWKLQNTGYNPTMGIIADSVLEKKKQIVTDTSLEGYEAELLRNYYDLAVDWDARNADGADPLKKYMEAIDAAGSLEELLTWMKDPETNPLAVAPVLVSDEYVVQSEVYEGKYALATGCYPLSLDSISGPDHSAYMSLSYTQIQGLEAVKDTVNYVMGRMGYSEDESEKCLERCFSFESKLAHCDNYDPELEQSDATYSRAELLEYAGAFPLDEFLDGMGFIDTDIFVTDPKFFKGLSKIWKESNLDEAKAFLKVHYVLKSSGYLDRETYDKTEEFYKSRKEKSVDYGETEEEKMDSLVFDGYIGGTGMVGAMNELYVKNFFDDSCVSELTSMTEDVIDGFRVIFNEEPWLSDEGRKLCREKLDAISIHIAYQDFDSVDYSEMDMVKREEGGNFLEAYYETSRFRMQHAAELSVSPYSRDYWDPLDTTVSTTVTNAMYRADTNGIYIFAGICEEPVYSKEFSYEEKLGGLFTVVGHEITHGFDKNGAMYDKTGKKNSWLPEEDQMRFNDLNDKVARYYTQLSPYPASGMYDGSMVNAEATADMGGLRVTLYMASLKPDFDYNRYFKRFATVWRTNVPLDKEKESFESDGHPLAFYRVNVGVQQFDEFYETYDVKETDNMYLAPEKRIKVW